MPSSSSAMLLICCWLSPLLFAPLLSAQQRQYSPSRPKSQQFAAAKAKAPANAAATGGESQQQFMTAPQCRCKDLEECAKEISKLVEKCKSEPKCEAHLKKIGNAAKIRQCLADEQRDMEKLEECVEKRVGSIGCTNDEHPKNLTIPIIPGDMMGTEGSRRRRRATTTDWDFEDLDWTGRSRRAAAVPSLPATQEAGHAPAELSDYLMCVDQCAVQAASPNSAPKLCATREGNMNCAFKLKCALAPPDEKQVKAFDDCEKQMQLTPPRRLKKSCECLKAAGVKIVCPK